jgi:hypothetical protein
VRPRLSAGSEYRREEHAGQSEQESSHGVRLPARRGFVGRRGAAEYSGGRGSVKREWFASTASAARVLATCCELALKARRNTAYNRRPYSGERS